MGMECLSCGDCCKRMCPISPDPCKFLVSKGTIHVCSVYDKRPKECVDHHFTSRYCPIGINVLNLKNLDQIFKRIDEAWEFIKQITPAKPERRHDES